jgi:Ca2+-binding RTX toxin-like protein
MAVLRTYSATTAALSPLAQWRFDEAGGPTLVDSEGGLDGVYQGAVSFGQSGAVGADGAVRFGGGGSFALIQSAGGGDLTVELAAFGDSLVAGFRVAAADAFPVRLEAALDARGLEATVTDFGVSGRTTGAALNAVPSVIGSDPDVVISVHGTNDSLRSIAPATVEANLSNMIQRFQAADIEVLLTGTFGLWPDETFDNPGYDTTDPANAQLLASQFEAIFPRLADQLELELLNPFLGGARVGNDIVGGVLGNPALNQGDGIHPNAAGVDDIVNRIVPQAMLSAAASGALVAPDEPLLLANGTVEAWFNADDVSARQGLFSKDAAGFGTGGHLSAAIQNGAVSVGLEGLTGGAFVQGAVQADSDTHLVLTFGAGGMQLFLNGVLVDSDGFSGGLDIGVDGLGNFEPLVLGALIDTSPNRSAGTPTSSFAGTFDELAIYDRALTADQIQELFAAGERGGRLTGTIDPDQLIGGVDDETLRGLAGDDDLQGGAGSDRLNGGGGADVLQGGDGDDILLGGAGLDDLWGDAGNDRLEGRLGADSLTGGDGNDILRGNNGPDTLRGEGGDDQLFGNKGLDTIDGGPGADLIDGGRGADLLTGGADADRFVIARLRDGVDRITDFEVGIGGDVLDLGSLLRGFQPDTSRPADFIRLDRSGSDTTVAVDRDGAGDAYTAVANLLGISGVSLAQLVADNNLELT